MDASDREMAALAFIAYAGELLQGEDDEVEKRLAPCVKDELWRQALTRGRFELAWGPSVSQFVTGEYDDNMMYAVRRADDASSMVVAIRGTNGPAFLDWLLESLDVWRTVRWPFAPAGSQAGRIARGVHTGLDALCGMIPTSEVPGGGRPLRAYLAEAAAGGLSHVVVVGHSLGGSLAPAYALYLEDTHADWDPEGKVTLSVVALAGPTPGDRDFAHYYDAHLGAATRRLHNRYDASPHAWEARTIREMPGLYRPSIEPPLWVGPAACATARKARALHYLQIRADAPPIPGAILPGERSYLGQIGWQHVCGYLCGLGIARDLEPVTLDCEHRPPPRCPRCP